MTKGVESRTSQLCIDPFLETLGDEMLQAFRLGGNLNSRIAVLRIVLPPFIPKRDSRLIEKSENRFPSSARCIHVVYRQ